MKKEYVSKERLRELLIQFQNNHDDLGNELGEHILKMVKKISSKKSFSNYSFKEEMESHALLSCVKSINRLNPDKNIFAYLTTVIINSFIQIIKKEKLKFNRTQDLKKLATEVSGKKWYGDDFDSAMSINNSDDDYN